MTMLPYARQVVDGGKVFCVCPRCGEHIELRRKKDSDSFSTDAYAEHFKQEHSQ